MARLLEYDEDEALTKAMHAFRKRGYAGVSIKTLEAETGLSSGSLYNSFGGKDGVFQRSLNHYNETVVKKRIAKHLDPAAPIEGLVSLFSSLLDEPGGTAFGCLLTNSAVEFAGHGNASPEIKRGYDMFLNAFKAILLEIPSMQADAAHIKSLSLLTYYQGLLVLIRHGYDKTALRTTIKPEILSILGDKNAE